MVSAGLLMCRRLNGELEFFLVHPGGPYYAKKNEGVWGIPKGIVEKGEIPELAARREFIEETGIEPASPFFSVGSVTMKSGKTIHAWAFAGEWDATKGITSNTIIIEWPPRSGKRIEIPEIDNAVWASLAEASAMIHPAQLPFLIRASALPDLFPS